MGGGNTPPLKQIYMGKNIVDLSNIETKDLIHELYERGYYTNLLFCLEDVNMQLENINEDRDEENQIVLTEEQKKGLLDDAINFDYHCSQINDDIENEILNYE